MVWSALLYQMHKMLNEIFKCGSNFKFVGLPVIVCGDLYVYQLPQLKGLPIYVSALLMMWFRSLDLWRKFKMAVLQEVMRQMEYFNFSLLNKIRKRETDKHMIVLFIFRFARDLLQVSLLILSKFKRIN